MIEKRIAELNKEGFLIQSVYQGQGYWQVALRTNNYWQYHVGVGSTFAEALDKAADARLTVRPDRHQPDRPKGRVRLNGRTEKPAGKRAKRVGRLRLKL